MKKLFCTITALAIVIATLTSCSAKEDASSQQDFFYTAVSENKVPVKSEISYFIYSSNDGEDESGNREVTERIDFDEVEKLYAIINESVELESIAFFGLVYNIPFYLSLGFEEDIKIMFMIDSEGDTLIQSDGKYYKTDSEELFQYLHGFIGEGVYSVEQLSGISEITFYYSDEALVQKEILISEDDIKDFESILKKDSDVMDNYITGFVNTLEIKSDTGDMNIKLLDINAYISGEDEDTIIIVNDLYWYDNEALYEKLAEIVGGK